MSEQNSKTARELPKGFSLVEMETEAGGVKYNVLVPQGESLSAWLDAYRALEPDENPEEIVLRILNAGNAQGARQGPKASVRKAVEAHGADSDEARAAIAAAQESGKTFLQGAPRAGGGGGKKHESGLTAKQRTELGTEVAMVMATTGKPPSQEKMAEIAKRLGIDPKALAA